MKHTVAVELYYLGAWHDLVADDRVYTSTVITSARYGAMQGIPWNPGTTTAAIANPDGRYHPANPMSPLYGDLVRNMPARITIDGIVCWTGEAAEYRPQRPLGRTRRIELVGGGVLRRLGIGTPAVLAALVSTVLAMSPVVFWPLDDGPDATMGGSVLPGAPGIPAVGTVAFGAVAGPPGAPGPYVELASSATAGQPALTATLGVDTTSSYTIDLLWRGLDAGTGATPIVLDWRTDSAIEPTWFIQAVSFMGAYELRLVSSNAFNLSAAVNVLDGVWYQIRVVVATVGPNVTASLYLDDVLVATDTQATTAGTIRTMTVYQIGVASCSTASIGAIAVHTGAAASTYDAVGGYAGEYAADRFVRVAAEHGITATVVGTPAADSQPMGPQAPATVLDTLYGAVVADGGIAYERAAGGLELRCLRQLYNQTPALVVDVDSDVVPPLAQVIGDRAIRNDVTAKRASGASARFELTGDPMGVEDPPTGAGRYPTTLTVEPSSDSALDAYARWLVAVSTFAGVRYSSVTLDLDANPDLDLSALEIGTLVQLDNVPAIDDPETPRLFVVGIDPDLVKTHRHTMTLLTIPADPYQLAMVNDTVAAGRMQAIDSTLAAALDEDSRVFTVAGTALWTTRAGAFPVDIIIAGEVITLESIAGAASPQTFTARQRGRNGVRKSHALGTPVKVHRAGRNPM